MQLYAIATYLLNDPSCVKAQDLANGGCHRALVINCYLLQLFEVQYHCHGQHFKGSNH